MDNTVQKQAVLYADISGSTRMYEQYGDTIARQDVDTCLHLISEIAADYEGQTIKTIGDEIMCVFANPSKAAMAACEIHASLREASALEKFKTGTVRVKVGWHYGPIYWRDKELVGEAPVTAQQVIRLAKPEETLTSKRTIDALPTDIRDDAHLIDTVEAEAWEGNLEVYSMPWREEEDATVVGKNKPGSDTAKDVTLTIEHQGKQYRVDRNKTHFHVGRGAENDLSIQGHFISRLHAEIMYRNGGFQLHDNSTNGTLLIDAHDNTKRLHREQAVLSGSGKIIFGGTESDDPDAVVSYHIE